MLVFRENTFCSKCEGTVTTSDEIARCLDCLKVFHPACVGLPGEPKHNHWQCQDCAAGLHPCFICKSPLGLTVPCSIIFCKKYYHKECVTSDVWPQSETMTGEIKCPSHFCHTCKSENITKCYSVLLRCIRCPTAYHSEDFCLAAGSIPVSKNYIICPKHLLPGKKKSLDHLNTSWCFNCSSGGSLICCDQCPASFHAECLKIAPPDGMFFCDTCRSGRRPLCNEILWVKYGSYRWWPSQVLHPNLIPDVLKKLSQSSGDFGVKFCGEHDYAWTNIGRCYLYQAGDSDRVLNRPGHNKIDVKFASALQEAEQLFKQSEMQRMAFIEKLALKIQPKNPTKPDPFIRIKTNKPFEDCPVYSVNIQEEHVCECNPNSENPCGKDSDCINQYLTYECCPLTCPARDKCQNRRFQNQIYPKLEVKYTQNKGWGLYPKENISKGDFVIEYVGELITIQEYKKRQSENPCAENHYYMVMDNHRVIDAGPKGNNARFMNHSCDPNCETQKWMVNGDTRIGLFALQDIKSGTELTFNYQFESTSGDMKKCHCGAKKCTGYIGKRVTKDKSSTPVTNSKRGRRKSIKNSEIFCFQCLRGGDLVPCDDQTCYRAYHVTCIFTPRYAKRKWYCPSHTCSTCKSPSSKKCDHCPTSFCKDHETQLKRHATLGTICRGHKDTFADMLQFYKVINSLEPVSKENQDENITMNL